MLRRVLDPSAAKTAVSGSKFFASQKISTPSSSLVRTRAFQARCAGSNPAGVIFYLIRIDLAVNSGYSLNMTIKQKVMRAVRGLPENASFEDAMERLLFLAKIEKGLRQADAGKTIAHEKVKQKMKGWLK